MQGPTIVEGKQLVKIGDEVICSCPGGPHKIITGAQTAFLYGIQITLVGDKSSCGATIVNGTSFFSVHGANAAFDGSHTSCGGIVRTPQHHYAPGAPVSNPATSSNLSDQKRYARQFRLVDSETQSPLANRRYTALVDGQSVTGVTNASGIATVHADRATSIQIHAFFKSPARTLDEFKE